jgi:hypothetical protein
MAVVIHLCQLVSRNPHAFVSRAPAPGCPARPRAVRCQNETLARLMRRYSDTGRPEDQYSQRFHVSWPDADRQTVWIAGVCYWADRVLYHGPIGRELEHPVYIDLQRFCKLMKLQSPSRSGGGLAEFDFATDHVRQLHCSNFERHRRSELLVALEARGADA